MRAALIEGAAVNTVNMVSQNVNTNRVTEKVFNRFSCILKLER